MLSKYNLINGIVQYNQVITSALPNFNFYPSILTEMDHNGQDSWKMNLPARSKNKKIILHCQDHLNVHNNYVPELEVIENYYKTDLNDIVVIFWNHNLQQIYNGELNIIEFPTHSFDWIQHLKNKSNWTKKIKRRYSEYKFISLNGKPRKFRIRTCNYLQEMYDNFYYTLGPKTNNEAPYRNYDFNNAENFIKLLNVYSSANVNVINETMYYESHGIISEKTLFAFAGLQLPIIIGHKGIVDQLRNSGFDMFDDVLDNCYVTIDNDTRWQEAFDLNRHILNNEFDYSDLLPRLIKNQEYLLSGYLDKILTDFISTVNDKIL